MTHGESFISEGGLAAVFLLGFLEAACVPIPSEITFGFAGVLSYQGHLNIAGVIVIGRIAELLGSFLSYAVGRIGERPLVERFGREAGWYCWPGRDGRPRRCRCAGQDRPEACGHRKARGRIN